MSDAAPIEAGATPSAGGLVSVRETVRLAIPATLAGILQQAYRPLDQYFVSGLGKEAQGAIGSTTFVLILVTSGFLLLSAGVGPLVARATGGGDAEGRRRTLGAGLFGCVVLSVVLSVGGSLLAAPIVDQLGLSGPTRDEAVAYLRTIFATGPALVLAPLVNAAFQGMGDTRLPLWLQVVNIGINVALNPLLIYRAGLGTAGSALASTIGQSVAVAVGLYVLVRRTGTTLAHVRPGPELSRVLKVGVPIAFSTAAYALVYLAMLRTSISPLGPAVNAGLGIGFGGLEAITWPLYLGGSTAMASMIGRALGAGRPDEAWRAVRMLAAPTFSLGVACGLVFFFGGPWLVGGLAADQDALREGVRYASVLAFSQPFVAVEAYAEGVLAGAGDSRKLFWATVPFNTLRVPLAWWFAIHLGYGAAGVWWAINLTTYMKAFVKTGMIRQGGWATVRI